MKFLERFLKPGATLGAAFLLLAASAAWAFSIWLERPLSPRGATAPSSPSQPRAAPAKPQAAAALPAQTRAQGAELPYDELEAETGLSNAELLGPDRSLSSLASEASGRRCLRLSAQGHYVRLVAPREANSIVVRYAVPDAPGGGGAESSLSLYVDGSFRMKLKLSSRHAWAYKGWSYPYSKDPADGGPHHFFDEVRALTGPIPAGAALSLQKDASDKGAWAAVDLVDLELVDPPLARPANTLSIADFGARPAAGKDNSPALRACIRAAQSAGKGVWIPAGTYECLSGDGFSVSELTVRGAGMWHSTLRGPGARFKLAGDNQQFYDFALSGDTLNRSDTSTDSGFRGQAGSDSVLSRVWIEHFKSGAFFGGGGKPTRGLLVSRCRIRNTWAEGLSLPEGASASTVEHCSIRNTGDDGLALWSPAAASAGRGNAFRRNTVQAPWRGSALAVYGGEDNAVEDNLCADTANSAGILLAQQYSARPFAGTTRVLGNSLLRCGGAMGGQSFGALVLWAAEGPISGVQVGETEILESTFAGLQILGPAAVSQLSLAGLEIAGAGGYGVELGAGSSGRADLSLASVTRAAAGDVLDGSGGAFALAGRPGPAAP